MYGPVQITSRLWHPFGVSVREKQNQKMNEIILNITQFIKDKLGVDESAMKNNASFYDDLEVDSLDFCELIVDIEREFEITIPDDVYGKFKTVGALVNYVAKKIDAKYPIVSDMNMMTEERLSA